MGSQRVRHDLATKEQHIHVNIWARFWKNTHQTVNSGIPLEGSRNERGNLGTKNVFTIYFIYWCMYCLNLLQNCIPLWPVYFGGGGLVTKSCPTLTTPWTVACQAPLSMGFSRQEYWKGCHFLLWKIFLILELNGASCTVGRFFTDWATRVGWYFLLQGIFQTQGSNTRLFHLLYWKADFYHCVTWEAPCLF